MANSYETTNGDGSTVLFSIPFPFLEREHVHVYLDGVETFDFTWITDGSIQMNTAPASGIAVRRQRITPTNAPVVDFENGSTITEDELDLQALQSLYVAQETADLTANQILFNDGAWDANGSALSNLADPADADDAATKGYVDGLTIAAGNVPAPVAGDTGRVLTATGVGTWAWNLFLAATSNIADAAVTAGKIAADAVTTDKILDAAVTAAKLATDAVTSAKLAADAVTQAKIADNAVDLNQMAHGTEGDILYFGASGVPSRLARGTDGQALQLASGLPSWQDAGGSAWKLVTTLTPSSVAEVQATGLDFSDADLVSVSGVITSISTDSRALTLEIGHSVGFRTTDYEWRQENRRTDTSSAVAITSGASQAHWEVSPLYRTAATNGAEMDFEIFLRNPNDLRETEAHGWCKSVSNGIGGQQSMFFGHQKQNTTVSRLRLGLDGSGTLSGTIHIWKRVIT